MNQLILKPRLSEKAYGLSQAQTYTFDVVGNASKQNIAQAVSTQYNVSVARVNSTNVNGKSKRTFVSRRGKFVRGTRSDVKKAYVTLKKGDSIPIFAAEEEAEAKQEKVQETVQKAIEKEAKKEEQSSAPRRFGLGRRAAKRTGVRGNR
jgi:large subunit ribosomal protein L23